MNLKINYRITSSQHAGLVHTYPDIFENWDFFSVLASCPHVNGVFAQQKRRFSKTVPSEDFFVNDCWSFRADGRKRKLANLTVMSYIIKCMSCKGCHHISIVLAFSRGQTETIRIRCVWTTEGLILWLIFAVYFSWLSRRPSLLIPL